MPSVHSVHIEAPVERVFEFFRDPRQQFTLAPDDRVEVTDVELTKDGVGTTYRYTMRLGGVTRAGSVRYTEFIPNQLIVDSSSFSMHGAWRYEFEPEGTGTRFTIRGQAGSFWRIWPLSYLLDRLMSPRHEHWLARLAETLEAPDRLPAATSARESGS